MGVQGRFDLMDRHDEIRQITIDQIPMIGLKLVIDIFDEALRAIQVKALVPTDQEPQKTIEAEKVIDMSMRYEDVLHALDVPRRQRRDIAEVEQYRVLREQRFDIERWIAGSPVNQSRMEQRPQRIPSWGTEKLADSAGEFRRPIEVGNVPGAVDLDIARALKSRLHVFHGVGCGTVL